MKWHDGLIRGKVVEEFTFSSLCQLIGGMTDNWKLEREHQCRVIVGYDTRFQADQSARICAEMLAAKGIKTQLDKVPIPLGALLLAMQRENAFGMLLTGGECAVEYTGLRMIHQDGNELGEEDWTKWKKGFREDVNIAKLDFAHAVSSGAICFSPILENYLSFLRNHIDCEKLKSSGLRVVFDSLYGSAQGVIKQLFYSENMQEIHEDKHSMFGGLVPALSIENAGRLAYNLQQRRKHLGILFDPEGRGWTYVNGKSGAVKDGKVLLALIEKTSKAKKLDVVFPNWKKDGILCSLLFLECIVEI